MFGLYSIFLTVTIFCASLFICLRLEVGILQVLGVLGLKKIALNQYNRNIVDVVIILGTMCAIIASFWLVTTFYRQVGVPGINQLLITYALFDLSNAVLGALYISKDPINAKITVNAVKKGPLEYIIHPDEVNAILIGRIIGFAQAFVLVSQRIL